MTTKNEEQLFNLDGVLGKNTCDIRHKFYVLKNDKGLYQSNINLYKYSILKYTDFYTNLVINQIFENDVSIYNSLIDHYFFKMDKNKYYTHAGLGSESAMSKENFVDFIDKVKKEEDIIKFFYSFELLSLMANVDKLVIQVEELIWIFYEKFNQENILGEKVKDGLTTLYSLESRFINSILESILIKATSILDYLSKFCFEMENLPTVYNAYPKSKSLGFNHGKTKFDDKEPLGEQTLKWSKDERKNSIFDEDLDEIFILKKLRNQIIHNGFLDMENAIYQNTDKGMTLERFILMPDYTGGTLHNYKGRTLFYSQDKKLNLLLPELLTILMKSVDTTLNMMMKKYFFGEQANEFSLRLPDQDDKTVKVHLHIHENLN